MRIAVTQDALRLWRLLLADSSSLNEEVQQQQQKDPHSQKPISSSDPYAFDSAAGSSVSTNESLPSPDSLGIPASVLWDVCSAVVVFNIVVLPFVIVLKIYALDDVFSLHSRVV